MGLGASSPNRVTASYVKIILTVFPYVTFTVVVIVRRLLVHGQCRECNGSPMYRQSAGAHDRGDVDALLFLPVLFRAYSKVATNVCQHGLMSAKENGHVPLIVRGT